MWILDLVILNRSWAVMGGSTKSEIGICLFELKGAQFLLIVFSLFLLYC